MTTVRRHACLLRPGTAKPTCAFPHCARLTLCRVLRMRCRRHLLQGDLALRRSIDRRCDLDILVVPAAYGLDPVRAAPQLQPRDSGGRGPHLCREVPANSQASVGNSRATTARPHTH